MVRTELFYSKEGDFYNVKLDNPFAEPLKVDANIFSELLRKHGRSLNGNVSTAGSLIVDKDDLACVIQ